MNFDNEMKELYVMKMRDRKIQFSITVPPKFIKLLDEKASEAGISRGDLLASCFLRVYSGNKEKEKYREDFALEGRERMRQMIRGCNDINES